MCGKYASALIKDDATGNDGLCISVNLSPFYVATPVRVSRNEGQVVP